MNCVGIPLTFLIKVRNASLRWTTYAESFANFTHGQMNTAIKTKRWKGLLASLILSGAGQFLSGARRRGIIWFVIAYTLPFLLLSLYSLPLMPAKAAIVLLGVSVITWLVMLYDSYRPIARLRWWGWLLLILFSLALSEVYSIQAELKASLKIRREKTYYF